MTMKKPFYFLLPTAALFLLFAPALPAQAPQPQSAPSFASGKSGAPGEGRGMEVSTGCAAMIRMRQQSETDRKADEDRLRGLMAKMNRATGGQKTQAMATVLN